MWLVVVDAKPAARARELHAMNVNKNCSEGIMLLDFKSLNAFFFLLVKIKFNLLFVVCLLTKFNAIIIPRPSRIHYLD